MSDHNKGKRRGILWMLGGVALFGAAFLPDEFLAAALVLLTGGVRFLLILLGPMMLLLGIRQVWGENAARKSAAALLGAVLLLLLAAFGQMGWEGQTGPLIVGLAGVAVLSVLYVLWLRKGAPLNYFLD